MSENIIELVKKETEEIYKSVFPWFWEKHILIVVRMTEKLLESVEADEEICLLSAYLHDVGRTNETNDDHDVSGIPIIEEVLTKLNYPKDKIEKVKRVCRTHRCRDVMPESVEAKVLASADAMSTLIDDFLFRVIGGWVEKIGVEKAMNKLKEKVDRSFNKKIFFEEGKDVVRDKYEGWMKVLE